MKTTPSAHNRLQRAYCEGFVAGTIMPRASRHLARQLDETLKPAAIQPGDRVLEVGCGMGRFTLPLAERGIRIEGLDLSPVLLDRFRTFEGGRSHVPLHVGDVADPPPDLYARFDVVLAFFALHHLASLADGMAGISRLLKPRGRIVALDANGINPLFYLQMFATPGMTWAGDKGMLQLRRNVMFRAMRSAGFVRPSVVRFGLFPSFVVDRRWGARAESVLERLPLPSFARAYQIFSAERA